MKEWAKFSGLQNGAIRGLQIVAGFRDYKLGQKDHKSGQGFQIGAKSFQVGAEITNRYKRDFRSGQGLKIGAEHKIL